MDSTGIKVEGEGKRTARKHGGLERRVWGKIHLGTDDETLGIRAVEVTASHIGDAQALPDLLGQIPADQKIGSVTADGAYDTRKCHDDIADRGAHAVIPPRKNAKPSKTITAGAVARNEALRASKYLGRALLRCWSGDHRRCYGTLIPAVIRKTPEVTGLSRKEVLGSKGYADLDPVWERKLAVLQTG